MNEAPDFILFLGRFHPLVVHLPIGFLIFAFLLELLGRKKKFEDVTSAVPLALFLGFASAVIASGLGYMLSLSGDYDESTLDTHFWFGIATTIITLLAWLVRTDKIKSPKLNTIKANISALTLIVVLISITGHYGGNLTHGSDYLTKYAPFGNEKEQELIAVTKVEDAIVYSYLVDPILENKCTSCHNKDKKKGGLMLHDSISILKGGKNGEVLIAGDASKSELIRRVLLAPHHDDFMPPEGKTPLTEEEIAIINYWINNVNASFNTKVASVETSDDILDLVANMLGIEGAYKKGNTNLPEVSMVSDQVLNEITSEGFVLKELVFDSGLYEAVLPPQTITTINANTLDKKLQKLSKIRANIIWLYIEDNQLKDRHLNLINQFENLQKLVIDRNNISDSGVDELANHQSIHSLNVYNTDITKASLETFSKMKNLQKVYAWHTTINKNDLELFTAEDDPKIVLGN